jgi:membrane protease YdiL (CAAX protease family)
MFWLWLLLYGLLFAVPRALMPAAAPLLTPALLAVYWAVLLRYLHTRGRLRSYGLCRGRGLTARNALLSLPVLLFAALNIAFGGARPGIAEAVYLLFAVFGEEVLFRGVLPAVWGEKLGAAGAAAASAALFALLHLGSAVGGSVSAAAVQALCAFGAGLLLTAVRE